jgi:alkylated DNA repair dioxygenase AlkB
MISDLKVSVNPGKVDGLTVYENVATVESQNDLIKYSMGLVFGRSEVMAAYMHEKSLRKGENIPLFAVPLLISLALAKTGFPIYNFNSCDIMVYNGGAGFRPHLDSTKRYGDVIAAYTFGIPSSTVNFGAVSKFMAKRHKVSETFHKKVSIPMQLPAIWVMSGSARSSWTHSISPIPKESKQPRISYVFRQIIV